MTYIITDNGLVFDVKHDLFIPCDPANTDYQAYLAWLAEGNEPLPADPQPTTEEVTP